MSTKGDKLVFEYLRKPVIALVGMFVVGAIIDSFLHLTNTFTVVFTGVGGVGLFVSYYKRLTNRDFGA